MNERPAAAIGHHTAPSHFVQSEWSGCPITPCGERAQRGARVRAVISRRCREGLTQSSTQLQLLPLTPHVVPGILEVSSGSWEPLTIRHLTGPAGQERAADLFLWAAWRGRLAVWTLPWCVWSAGQMSLAAHGSTSPTPADWECVLDHDT